MPQWLNEGGETSGHALTTQLQNNPRFDMEFYVAHGKFLINKMINMDECYQNAGPPKVDDSGECYIPILASRSIELPTLCVDGVMWKLPNLNQMAPISVDM